MRYLLDTCTISEFVKPRPEPSVVEWVRGCTEASLFCSALTLGEIQKGIHRLAASRKQTSLQEWLTGELTPRFRGRILDVTPDVALRWGIIQAAAEVEGRTMPVIDALIAATALEHDLTVVTRNRADMEPSGVRLLDPWPQARTR